jgi:hypothetical protein
MPDHLPPLKRRSYRICASQSGISPGSRRQRDGDTVLPLVVRVVRDFVQCFWCRIYTKNWGSQSDDDFRDTTYEYFLTLDSVM